MFSRNTAITQIASLCTFLGSQKYILDKSITKDGPIENIGGHASHDIDSKNNNNVGIAVTSFWS